ncbi:hypothetical protein KGQ72_01320 [Patescibacteria group bacterium]|nr:hypothetical protein [Patescibacteria group bacterium]
MGDVDFAMMRGIFTFFTLASVIYFPWLLTALLALAVSSVEPLIPLAAGLFADTLYYTPQAGVPLFTLFGAGFSALALLVRSRLLAGTMG